MWRQVLDPCGNIMLSALVAAIPIAALFWALAVKKMKGYQAGLLTLALALLLAAVAYGMPLRLAVFATLHGSLYGLFPISWVILTAVFLYNITLKTGQFEVIQASIASITADRRLQALLIAFCFSSFLEGCAGFGTPVAISAGMLVGLGFHPLNAASLCLIANTAPVAFGSIGIPLIVAGQVSGIGDFPIAQMVGRQLPLLSVIVPVWLVVLIAGWKGLRETWPAVLICGGTYALAQWASSNYLGAMLPDIISSLTSIVCLVCFLKRWQPRTLFRFPTDPPVTPHIAGSLTLRRVLRAWSPFLILTVMIGDWGLKPIKSMLDRATFKFGFPIIHNGVLHPESGQPIAAQFSLNWLSAAGTAILITALVTILIYRMRPRAALAVFGQSVKALALPMLTISSFLGYAYLGNASGMTHTLGLALAHTGPLFPLFSPVLGWLGVFITGSDTSSNAIFSKLQAVTADKLGISPILTVAANASGGVAGKMISPQSIAVACAATGMVGQEAELFRRTIVHSIGFVAIIGVITYLQATLLRGMIPPMGALTAAATPVNAVSASSPIHSGGGTLILSAVAIVMLGIFVNSGGEGRGEKSR